MAGCDARTALYEGADAEGSETIDTPHRARVLPSLKVDEYMIEDWTIRKIKEAADIVDVVADFYPIGTKGGLRKMGVEYSCPCPFHGGQHYGSFKVSPKKNFAKCFSCDWEGDPIAFLMEHEKLSFLDAVRWLGKKYGIEVEGSEQVSTTPKPRKEIPVLPTLELPMWMVTRTEVNREQNTLIRWLRSLKWDQTEQERLDYALAAYHIGRSKFGHTIFWQIDENGKVHTGKMMKYREDGHRDKEAAHNFDWIHTILYKHQPGYSADKTDMKQCLFGMHLLNEYKKEGIDQDVCIVESEKSALIMSVIHGNHSGQIWMACGGLSNLNEEKLAPIIEQGRRIVLFPDRDGIDKWKIQASQIAYNRIIIDTRPVTKWWQPEDGEKADIADVVLRMRQDRKEYKTIDEVIEDHPQIKNLKDKLKLTLEQ